MSEALETRTGIAIRQIRWIGGRLREDQGDYIFCNPDGSPLKPDTVSASVSLLFRNLKSPEGPACIRSGTRTGRACLLRACRYSTSEQETIPAR